MSEEKKFPNFWRYTYLKWYFWVALLLYVIISNKGIYTLGEYIGHILATIFIISIFFFFSYLINRNLFKKRKKEN